MQQQRDLPSVRLPVDSKIESGRMLRIGLERPQERTYARQSQGGHPALKASSIFGRQRRRIDLLKNRVGERSDFARSDRKLSW